MKHCYLIVATFFATSMTFGQTLTLQPNALDGKDAFINDLQPDTPSGSNPDLPAIAWTNAGLPVVVRGLVQFDLSSLPIGTTINSATFYLYHNPNSQNCSAQHQSLSGSNEGIVSRITTGWDENTVNWNNQPTISEINQVTIPTSTSATQDYALDVTQMVQDMVNYPTSSYGFELQLVTESYYRSLIFASSDEPDATNHPKLVINYTTTAGLTDLESTSKTLIKIMDLMGREVSPCNNTPLLYLYSDGTIERVFKQAY